MECDKHLLCSKAEPQFIIIDYLKYGTSQVVDKASSSFKSFAPSSSQPLFAPSPPSPPPRLETRSEERSNVEAPNVGTTEDDSTPLTCHCKNIIFCTPLLDKKEFWFDHYAGAEEAGKVVLGLFAKPSLRVEEWVRKWLGYLLQGKHFAILGAELVVPPNLILFDVTPVELESRSCAFCLNFGRFDANARYSSNSFVAACCDGNGGWRFGFSYLDNDNLGVPVVLKFYPVGFGERLFSAIADTADIILPRVVLGPINTHPGNEQSHRMAQQWLSTCLESHDRCPNSTVDFMPTRLLEIKHFKNNLYPHLRLRETTSSDYAPYAALSYCWGGRSKSQDDDRKLHQKLTRLNYTDLPATIRDAITVTSEMGLQYLWIDSLCIIQDDSSDKNYEIGQMPLIYSQTTVTISASRAASVEEGFLYDRNPLDNKSQFPCLQFQFRGESGRTTSINLVPELAQQPLDTRGWALQERLLSVRVIEYGSVQTRWICMHDDWAPTDGLRKEARIESAESDIVFRKALDVIHKGGAALEDVQAVESPLISGRAQWKEILERYTQRTLTFSSDRLPAISGVAMRFAKILSHEYCAGLWKWNMKEELLWIVKGNRPLTPRPRAFQGPSWSWASINVPVAFLPNSPPCSPDTQFSIVSVTIKPVKSALDKFEARFGAVDSGEIVLQGKLRSAFWMRGIQKVIRRSHQQDGDPNLYVKFWADALEEDFENLDCNFIPVFLLKVVKREGVENWPLQSKPPMGLVLRQTGEAKFTRLGVFEFFLMRDSYFDTERAKFNVYQEQVAWVNDCEARTITIV